MFCVFTVAVPSLVPLQVIFVELTLIVNSTMVTVKVIEVTLPEASVAVYTTLVVPKGKLLPGALLLVSDTTVQLSVAVGTVYVTVPAQVLVAVKLAGVPTIFRGCVSKTVTCCSHEAELPLPSVTVHTTVLTPNTNTAGLATTLVSVQLSEFNGTGNCEEAYEQTPASTLILIGPAHVIVGFWLSTTFTLCAQVAVFPLPSVAVQVTVLAPRIKEAGLGNTLVTLQLSAPVGAVSCDDAYVQTPASALTLIGPAHVIVGFWLSTTVTVCLAVAVLPLASVIVQVTVLLPNTNVAGASFVVLAPVQLSSVVGAPRLTPPSTVVQTHKSVFTVTPAGALIVGASSSLIVTLNEQEAVCPAASFTVYVTVETPFANAAPLTSTLPVAVVAPVTP